MTTIPPGDDGDDTDYLEHSFLVTTTTYNNSPHGTHGQLVRGQLFGQTDDITSFCHGITDSAESDTGFRTNVGALNLGAFSVSLQVTVFDSDGNTLADKVPFELPPMSFVQNRLPAHVTNGTVKLTVVDSDPDQLGVIYPYTSMIDNLSGDPAYQFPALLVDGFTLPGGKSP